MALLMSFIWTTCDYRLDDIYIRAAYGELIALMFLPLVIGAVLILIYEVGEQYQRQAVIWLTIGMTGIIESHILSAEVVIMTSLIICVVHVPKLIKKEK